MPGEGAAAMVFKNALRTPAATETAFYAVIRGAGAAFGVSDGPAPLVKAFARAWEDAQADPSTLGLLEAHGSGAPAQDKAEAAAASEYFRAGLPCAVSGVKKPSWTQRCRRFSGRSGKGRSGPLPRSNSPSCPRLTP